MNEIYDWFQNNWIDLARLGVQIAILAAVVRYGRKLLATLRASQEQVGALLKLSVSDETAYRGAPAREAAREQEHVAARSEEVRHPRVAIAEPCVEESERELERLEPVFAGAVARSSFGEREQSLGGRVAGGRSFSPPVERSEVPVFAAPVMRSEAPELTPWVSAPAIEPEHGHDAGATAVPKSRNVSAWLQAPMRSIGVSPWRKMVRWLQAPAGH